MIAPSEFLTNLIIWGVKFNGGGGGGGGSTGLMSARLVSPDDLNATYNNGSSGIGATLTDASGSFAPLELDGVTPDVGDYVLVPFQTSFPQNGLYQVTTQGNGSSISWVLTRATFFDQPGQMIPGNIAIAIFDGEDYGGSIYLLINPAPVTVGTSDILFNSMLELAIFSAGLLKASDNLSDVNNVPDAVANLGLTIGTDVQAYSSVLEEIAAGSYTGYLQTANDLSELTPTAATARANIGVPAISSYAGNPNTHVAGALNDLVYDSTGNEVWICTTAGNAGSAVWTLPSGDILPVLSGAGSPSGAVAGTLGQLYFNTSITPYDPYVCAATGTSSTAVWSAINTSYSGTLPSYQQVMITANNGNQTALANVDISATGYSTANVMYWNGTNAIETLPGLPSNGVVVSQSSTVEWSSTLPLNVGGLAADLTASNGGIFYSTASAGAILAGTSTAKQALFSGASTTPSWSPYAFPSTLTQYGIIYASSTTQLNQVTVVDNGVMISGTSGSPSFLANASGANYPFISQSSAPPTWAAYTLPSSLTQYGLLYATTTGAIGQVGVTASAFLTTNSSGNPVWDTNLPVNVINPQIFNTAGSFNYTPSAGLIGIWVRMQAAGGGGGGVTAGASDSAAGAGGVSGTYYEFYMTAAQVASKLSGGVIALTVGAAGTSGANTGGTGGNGGNTTFADWTAGGGDGSPGMTAGTGNQTAIAANGTAASTQGTGTLIKKISGSGGGNGVTVGTSLASSGMGGGSLFAPGAPSQTYSTTSTNAGFNGPGIGTGGSGAQILLNTNAQAGGEGANGAVYIMEFCSQ